MVMPVDAAATERDVLLNLSKGGCEDSSAEESDCGLAACKTLERAASQGLSCLCAIRVVIIASVSLSETF